MVPSVQDCPTSLKQFSTLRTDQMLLLRNSDRCLRTLSHTGQVMKHARILPPSQATTLNSNTHRSSWRTTNRNSDRGCGLLPPFRDQGFVLSQPNQRPRLRASVVAATEVGWILARNVIPRTAAWDPYLPSRRQDDPSPKCFFSSYFTNLLSQTQELPFELLSYKETVLALSLKKTWYNNVIHSIALDWIRVQELWIKTRSLIQSTNAGRIVVESILV
jgi:hypothetical protein